MRIASILPPTAVLASIGARDKKQVLKMLAAKASELTGLSEREIFSTLLEREQIGCTGMGSGVCVPHGRFEKLNHLQAVFATVAKPVEFGAADGRPVDLVFLLLSPINANVEHVKALATISRLLRDKTLCEALRKATDAKILHQLLTSDRRMNASFSHPNLLKGIA